MELVRVSVSEGKAWVRAAFGYDCWQNTSYRTHHSVREPVMKFADTSPFLLSDDDNVLMGIGSDVVAEQTYGPLCQSYITPFNTSGPTTANGSCSGLGCCWAYVPPTRMGSYVTIRKPQPQHHLTISVGTRKPASGSTRLVVKNSICSYAMIVDRSWYNLSLLHLDLDNDAFLRRNDEGVVPVVVRFAVGEGVCPNGAGLPKPACASNNSECAQQSVAVAEGDNDVHYYHFAGALMGTTGIHTSHKDAKTSMSALSQTCISATANARTLQEATNALVQPEQEDITRHKRRAPTCSLCLQRFP